MTIPRLARPIQLLVALIALFATLLTTVSAASAAAAGSGECSSTKKHPHGCVVSAGSRYVTDTSVEIDGKFTTGVKAEISYHKAGANQPTMTQTDNFWLEDHWFVLNKLERGTVYVYTLTVTAPDGSKQSLASTFKTKHRVTNVTVEKVTMDDDGDNIGAGDIHAAFRMPGDPGGDTTGQVVLHTQQISSGHFVLPRKTFTYVDLPTTERMHLAVVDVDSDDEDDVWADEDLAPIGSGSCDRADWASAYKIFDQKRAGTTSEYVLHGTGGLEFHAKISVEELLTK